MIERVTIVTCDARQKLFVNGNLVQAAVLQLTAVLSRTADFYNLLPKHKPLAANFRQA